MEENTFYVLEAQSNQTFGPLNEEEVKDWIRQKRIGKFDSVNKTGEDNWTPIATSVFSDALLGQLSLDKIAASTCPNCNAEMVVLVGSSNLGLWLIIIGVILTPVFCIGTFLWVWGMFLRHGGKGKTYYQCPRCKFTTK